MGRAADDLTTGRGVTIPAAALRWQASRSGGPGGQHANTADTQVVYELHLDDADLPAAVDERLRRTYGKVVRVTAADSRSQFRNRKLARQRLADLVDDAAKPRPRRRPTTRTRGSDRRRLDAKTRQGQKKRDRAWRPGRDR